MNWVPELLVAVAILGAVGGLLAVVLWVIGERGRLILPSTRACFRQLGIRRVFRLQTWHFYIYGRWPRLYIAFLIHVLFRLLSRLGGRAGAWWADRYHGKVLTPRHAGSIITVSRSIPLCDLEQIVPYRTARKLLLQKSPDVVLYECPCRLAQAKPCYPTQVCMIIGQPFADLVLDHHPNSSRRVDQNEALAVLEAEHRRGHVHVAWFKDACLERFFAICNCCKCCCGGIEAMIQLGIPMMASSGFVAEVDSARCKGCRRCEVTCAFGAVSVDQTCKVDRDKCMGCGACVDRCRQDAMRLVRDESKGIPLDLESLITPQSH